MLRLFQSKDLIRQRHQRAQTCISSHEFITFPSADSPAGISLTHTHIILYTHVIFSFFLSFSGDDDALLIFLFSLVLFSPSIELEKRYSRAGQQSTRPSQIYTSCAKKQSTTTQHQKALYLRESMEIYIHIMCLFRECSFLSLSSLSLY